MWGITVKEKQTAPSLFTFVPLASMPQLAIVSVWVAGSEVVVSHSNQDFEKEDSL